VFISRYLGELFGTQCLHRFNGSGTTGWCKARRENSEKKKTRGGKITDRIESSHSEQRGAQQASGGYGADAADKQTESGCPEAATSTRRKIAARVEPSAMRSANSRLRSITA